MACSSRVVKVTVLVPILIALVFASAPPAHATDTTLVKWDRIIGFSSTPFPTIGGISAVGFPWTAQDGKARVDLGTGQIKFNVKGLVLAGSTPLAVAGTIGVTTKVKGTLVCNGLSTVTSTFVDTPSVPLDPQGDAEFVGLIIIPTDCLLSTDRLAFVIRVAEAAGNPALVDKWNAVGVVRTP